MSHRALAAPGGLVPVAWGAAAAAVYLAGATSKESAVVAPVVAALTVRLAPPRGHPSAARNAALLAALAAAAAAYVAMRARAVDAWNVSLVFRDVAPTERIGTALRVFAEYAGLLVAPLSLSAEYGPGQVPIARGLLDPGALAGGALLLGMLVAAFRFRRTRPTVAWGLATYLVILLPVSNVLFPVGVAKAERLLYAPSAGFLAALGAVGAAATTAPSRRRIGTALLAIAALALFVRAQARSRDWRDNCTLAAATIGTAPDSAVFATMHGRCLLDAGQAEEARRVLSAVLADDPSFPTAHLVLGDLEEREGNLDAALAHDEAVLAREPEHLAALSRSAVRLSRLGRAAEAAARYEAWRRVDPGDPRPWAGCIKAWAESGDPARASEVAAAALARFPRDELVQRNAAVLRRSLEGPAR
jgi:Flp pilus assembly protein TadD